MDKPAIVKVVVPFQPEYMQAKQTLAAVWAMGNYDNDDKARQLLRTIRQQVKDKFRHFDGHVSQPVWVDIEETHIVRNEIDVAVAFDDLTAAMLFKLTHGGE